MGKLYDEKTTLYPSDRPMDFEKYYVQITCAGLNIICI